MRWRTSGSRAKVTIWRISSLPLVVGRVGLAGEDELHRPVVVEQQRPQPLGLAEQQRRPLVGGEAAGEADGERVAGRAPRRPTRAPRPTGRGASRGSRRRSADEGRPARSRPCSCARHSSSSAMPPMRSQLVGAGARPVGPDTSREQVGPSRPTPTSRACTPLVTEAIGTSSVGTPGQRSPNISRLTSPCSADTPLRPPGQAQAHHRHVERLVGARRRVGGRAP